MATQRMWRLVEVDRAPGFAEAEQRALVLAAVGIGCRLVPEADGVALWVPEAEAARAHRQLALYARENPPEPPQGTPRPVLHGLDAALAYIAVLVFLSAADARHAFEIDWSAAGATQAGLIRAGEWWRAVTSLGLHADLGHLLSNLFFGVVLGLLAAQLLGAGLAWLAILMAGALGNGLNAAFESADHTAVGASTAVFGALGVLSGYGWASRRVPWRGGLRRWAPIAAGILLLVFLGTSGERTGVGAHVAGFVVGGPIGYALARAGGRLPAGPRAQAAYGIAALALVALAWLLALYSAG